MGHPEYTVFIKFAGMEGTLILPGIEVVMEWFTLRIHYSLLEAIGVGETLLLCWFNIIENSGYGRECILRDFCFGTMTDNLDSGNSNGFTYLCHQ